MELEAISGAATVALTSTIVFLLVAKTWYSVSRTLSASSNFSDRIMHEAAQRFRDELERLSAAQGIYLSGALAFAILFVSAYALKAQRLFSGYPSWQIYIQLTFLFLVAAYAMTVLLKTVFARRNVRFRRDASIAIGHQLHQLAAGGAAIYHDVSTAAGIIDHVIVSTKGVYAVNVFARRAAKRPQVRLQGNTLEFENGAVSFSIVDYASKAARLQKELLKFTDHKIRVRSVIAVPGWDIDKQFNDQHLLVNERTIAMLTGWNDNSDHLMNDDVVALKGELTSRCARDRRHTATLSI